MRRTFANKIGIALPLAMLLFTATAWSATPAESVAPEPLAPEPELDANIEQITITGQRPSTLRKLMNEFVLEIGDPVASHRGYARWQQRLCVGVYNLPDAAIARYLADKISLIALESGVDTSSPDCRPNLHIVFSPDARALANSMVEDAPLMFRPYGNASETTQGRDALEQFRNSDAAVRWWQITMVVDEMGAPAITLQFPGAEGDMVPVYRGMASRLKTPLTDVIWGELVIVDAKKVGRVSWPQLAGYLAMVSLAQIDPDGQPSRYPSILNLFSATRPPPGLTDMDRVYLRSLYAMHEHMFPHTQRGILANQMMLELRKGQ